MAISPRQIVVWERVNKSGKSCPYSPEISQFLEESRVKNLSIVCLREIDEALKIYSVDLQNMIQKSETTGTESLIKRNLYDSLNVLGRGFSWQWQDDHNNWNSYEVAVNDYIDTSFLEGKKSISLNRKFPGYHHEIIFSKMIQLNKHSKRKRKIQRLQNSISYPIENGSNQNGEEEMDQDDVPVALTSEYLNKEVPGTSALENQVNAYIRNVGNSDHNFQNHQNLAFGEDKYASNPPTVKYDDEKKSSSNSTTVALVNGRPWTDSRPPHTSQSQIKPVPGIDPLPQSSGKGRRKNHKGATASCPDDPVNVLDMYSENVDSSAFSGDENCIICYDLLSKESSYNGDTTVSKLSLCSHMFHKACLEAMYNNSAKDFLQCPTCKKIYGEKCGIQPPGEMIYHVLPYSLPGYHDNETIRIIYNIHSGVQGPNHPNPGHRYTAKGFPRVCYLPDSEMGRKVLRLLIKAWKRRLIFTIGRSSTTGEEGTVTWNEIHHKTEFGCNRRGHGFPDPNYFDNVLAELEAHGITDDEYERVWVPVE